MDRKVLAAKAAMAHSFGVDAGGISDVLFLQAGGLDAWLPKDWDDAGAYTRPGAPPNLVANALTQQTEALLRVARQLGDSGATDLEGGFSTAGCQNRLR